MNNKLYSLTATTLLLVTTLYSGLVQSQIVFNIPGASATYITGINEMTEVCGYAEYPNGSVQGFIRLAGDTIMVNFPDGGNTWLGGINDMGQVVGRYNPTGAWPDYHCFIYNYEEDEYTDMPQLNGYELLTPNDINNNGWISGELRDAAQRRIFTYHESQGMVTNFVIIGGGAVPTYGGHYISPTGMTSAYFINAGDQKGAWFTNGSGFADTLDLPDPVFSSAHRTRIMGANNQYAILNFVSSKTSYLYDYVQDTIGSKIKIPRAAEVYILDINDQGYVAGYYMDSSYVAHGFFQIKAEFGYDIPTDGWSFTNNSFDCWSADQYASISYNHDPYWHEAHGTNIPFPIPFPLLTPYPDGSFSSWPDMVKAFSESQFYNNDPNVSYVTQNTNAYQVWRKFRDNNFTGICWGMVANNLLHYEDNGLLTQTHPALGQLLASNAPGDLTPQQNDQSPVPKSRITQNFQFAKSIWSDVVQYDNEPFDIYSTLLSTIQSPIEKRIINIALLGEEIHGRHALMPYKLERNESNINWYRVWVYDPNDPGNLTRNIVCEYNETYSAYSYNFGGNWTAWNRYGLKYDKYKKAFTQSRELLSLTGADNSRDLDYVMLSLINRPNVTITNAGGAGTIEVDGFNLTNTIPGSASICLPTGIIQKPFDFKLPLSDYEGMTIATNDEPLEAWLNTEGYGTVMMMRTDTEEGDVDYFRNTDKKLFYINNGTAPIPLTATILTSSESTQLQYTVSNITVAPNQSIGLEILDATHVLITSNDAATSYDVNIQIYNPEVGFWNTTATNVPIGTDVTQLIIPSLTDDTMDGIIIETDANQDGTYELSDSYDNEGIPNMMLSHAQINVPNQTSNQSFHVSNVGGGNLNWTVVSSPSWISISTGATGVNHGPIEFTIAENTATTGRQDYIIVEASSPANDQDTVLVVQGEGGGVGIEKLILSDAVVSLMPNPAKDFVQFAIDYNDYKGGVAYSIYSATGQLVKEGKMRGRKEIINTSEMDRGVYQVKFIINGKTIVKKLVLS